MKEVSMKHVVGITQVKELVTTLRQHGVKSVDPTKTQEPCLLYITKPDTSVSQFIGYNWGDLTQDRKVETPSEGAVFYQLRTGGKQQSFQEDLLKVLNSFGLQHSDKARGVIGQSPLVTFAADSPCAGFEELFLDSKTKAPLNSFFISYTEDV